MPSNHARIGERRRHPRSWTAPRTGLSRHAPNLTYVPRITSSVSSFTFTVSSKTSPPRRDGANRVTHTPFCAITRGERTPRQSSLHRAPHGDAGAQAQDTPSSPSRSTRPTGPSSQPPAKTISRCRNSCLVTVDRTTAVTVIGPLDHDDDPETIDGPVPSMRSPRTARCSAGPSKETTPSPSTKKPASSPCSATPAQHLRTRSLDGRDDALWFINGDGHVARSTKKTVRRP